jgi:MCP family monocarboxylic acid transporter-like MFS transporter 3
VFVGGLASLTTDPGKLGVRFGMVCSALGFASLAGPPLAGALIQSDNGGFLKAQIWAGTVTICAALFICAAKWTQFKFDRPAQELSSGELEVAKQNPNILEAVEVGHDGHLKV